MNCILLPIKWRKTGGRTMAGRSFDRKIQQMTLTAMFTAMTVVLSLSIFSIPVPGGHLYFCDAVINIAAILLGPAYAFVVGGIGSFLGDFFFFAENSCFFSGFVVQ